MTRPPRMEGKVKEAQMLSKKKKPAADTMTKKHAKRQAQIQEKKSGKAAEKSGKKTQSMNTVSERKAYQLKSPKPKHSPRK